MVPIEELEKIYEGARRQGRSPSERESAERWLVEIVEHVDLIERYTAHGRAAFEDPESSYSDAVEMRIVKLGHAVAQLPEDVLIALGFDDMRALQKMRHRLAHNYRATNLDVVWVTATRDLPALRSRVVALRLKE